MPLWSILTLGGIGYLFVGGVNLYGHRALIRGLEGTTYRDLTWYGKVLLFLFVPTAFDSMASAPDGAFDGSNLSIMKEDEGSLASLYFVFWPCHWLVKVIFQVMICIISPLQHVFTRTVVRKVLAAFSAVFLRSVAFMAGAILKSIKRVTPPETTPVPPARRVRIADLQEKRVRLSEELKQTEQECQALELEEEAEKGAYRGKQLTVQASTDGSAAS